MRLAEMEEDAEGKIVKEFDERVSALGLHMGAEFRILKNNNKDPIVLRVKGSKVAIDRRIAKQIQAR